MQTLETPTTKIDYDLEKEIKESLRPRVKPVAVKVSVDANNKTVVLTIGNQPGLVLSTKQAWDLAREIRKAANRLGSGTFEGKKK